MTADLNPTAKVDWDPAAAALPEPLPEYVTDTPTNTDTAKENPTVTDSMFTTEEQRDLAEKAEKAAQTLLYGTMLVSQVQAALEAEGKTDDPGYRISKIVFEAAEKIATEVNKGGVSKETDDLLLIGVEALFRGVANGLAETVEKGRAEGAW